MAELTASATEADAKPTSLRTVITASSAGTTFEWYDFFVFGSLIGVISKTFFTGLPETAGFAAALKKLSQPPVFTRLSTFALACSSTQSFMHGLNLKNSTLPSFVWGGPCRYPQGR